MEGQSQPKPSLSFAMFDCSKSKSAGRKGISSALLVCVKAPRRLHHLRTDLHDRMKYFMEVVVLRTILSRVVSLMQPRARRISMPRFSGRLPLQGEAPDMCLRDLESSCC